MAHGFIKGLLAGGAVAAAGYAGYKMLNENQKKEVNRKVSEATDTVVEYILEAEAIASATLAAAKASAEESINEVNIDNKLGALKDQAEEFMNQAMDKAQSFKNDADLMEAVTEADIILDASDLVEDVVAPKVEVEVLLPEAELKATAKEQVKSLAKSGKKPLSDSKKQGLVAEVEDEDKNKSAAKSKSTKKSSTPKKKAAKTNKDTLTKSDRPALSSSDKSLADTAKPGLAETKKPADTEK